MSCGLQVDGGFTEVEPGTPTVLCIGGFPSVVNKLTKKLQLLKVGIDW